MMITVPAILIGGGILSLPAQVAGKTIGSDGWIAILASGILALVLTWFVAKLAAGFPNQGFLNYASAIITKPLAVIITIIFACISLLAAAYVIRTTANIAKEYLFDHTPIEAISLALLLVVVYAVAGSRVGLFRLNMLFFPFTVVIGITILVFNYKLFDLSNLLPVFKTDFLGYVKATRSGLTSYVGIGVLLYYIALMERPKNAPKMTILGMGITIVYYLMVFITCIAVLGQASTANLFNPTVELAKQAELPGGIFERPELVFFVIWTMSIFNVTVMAFDTAVLAVNEVFKKAAKIKIILWFTPLVYLINMLPQNYAQLLQFGTFVSYASLSITLLIVIVLMVIGKLRGVKTK
jgi:spore germination protein